MRGPSTVLSALGCLAAALVSGEGLAVGGQSASGLEPLTYVYDVPESSALALPDRGSSERTGWLPLEEDETAHAFTGCAVLMNDKLMAVQRKATAQVDLYTRHNGVATLCARLQPLAPRAASQSRGEPAFAGPAVIYPIDRVNNSPFITPLEKLTVVDLVRMTLGVGPCQYILDLEGQKRNSRGVATCYARDVINDIYKRNAQAENGPVIEQHLAEAVAFITNVRERIDQYVDFGREMNVYLEEQTRLDPSRAAIAEELGSITRKIDGLFEQHREQIHSPAYAAEVANRFRQELLTYTGKDAFAKCEDQMGIFTSIGGAQDGLVASCRTIVKTLRQRAGIAMAMDPQLKDVATEVRDRTQAILRNPTAYEAPRH